MVRSFRHALSDMLEAIAGIEAAATDKTLADYQSDWLRTSVRSDSFCDLLPMLHPTRLHGRVPLRAVELSGGIVYIAPSF